MTRELIAALSVADDPDDGEAAALLHHQRAAAVALAAVRAGPVPAQLDISHTYPSRHRSGVLALLLGTLAWPAPVRQSASVLASTVTLVSLSVSLVLPPSVVRPHPDTTASAPLFRITVAVFPKC